MGRTGKIRRVKVKSRAKAPAGIARFKKKISALHTEMVIRILKDREIEPAFLGELLEDMGNEFLDLADEIRLRILAANRSEARAMSAPPAGGNLR
jgi:hypothetical protein